MQKAKVHNDQTLPFQFELQRGEMCIQKSISGIEKRITK